MGKQIHGLKNHQIDLQLLQSKRVEEVVRSTMEEQVAEEQNRF